MKSSFNPGLSQIKKRKKKLKGTESLILLNLLLIIEDRELRVFISKFPVIWSLATLTPQMFIKIPEYSKFKMI